MHLRYGPDMLEESVTRELLRRDTAGDTSWNRDFHVVTDACYSMPQGERDTRFREANALFFRQLGLAKPLDKVVLEYPALMAKVDDVVLDRANSATEEEADLCVVAGGHYNVRLRVRVHRADDPAALEGFLRHELWHVEDMLRPEFKYRPLARIARRPAEENLVRARLRLLWNLVTAGAIERKGRRGAATREEWATMVHRNYPGFEPAVREKVLAAMWTAASLTWPRLTELAVDPELLLEFAGLPRDTSPRGPGSLCPLCSFPTFDWQADVPGLPEKVLAQVQADFPLWNPKEGGCRQCLDSYVLRIRFSSGATSK